MLMLITTCQVGSIWLNCGDTCPEDDPCTNPCYDPTTALVYDDLSWADGLTSYLADSVPQLAKDQMSYLSWPPSEDVAPQRFTFDDTAGEGITVYILDTGANLGKSVSRPIIPTPRHNTLLTNTCRNST